MVRRTRNGTKLCERPPCARGMPRSQPRPKMSAQRPPSQNRPAEKGQNGGGAIALVGGWGEVGPPDSEWDQTLRAATVSRGLPRAQPHPKTSARRPPSQNPLQKMAQTGGGLQPWCGGWAKLVRRARNGAKLCERPPSARGMPRAQPRPKKKARSPASQNPHRKMAHTRGVL